MNRYRLIGLILGVGVFLTAFGVTLALTVFQVSREVPSKLDLRSAVVISGENLGLWHDRERTNPVTFLNYVGVTLEPPLEGAFDPEAVVYVENLSTMELTILEPCGGIESDGISIGSMHANLHDVLTGEYLGETCDRAKLPPGRMAQANVRISLQPGLPPGEYEFPTTFGGVAFLTAASPGTTFEAWSEVQPVIDGIESPGEWDDAECHTNPVLDGASDLTICVKNDQDNLYVAVEVPNQTYSDPGEPGFDFLNLLFDNDNDGVVEVGDDRLGLRYDNVVVNDGFNPTGVPHHSSADTSDGGTNDIVAALTHTNPGSNTVGTYFAEYQHPLDTTDDAHDFSLSVGDVVGFAFRMADGDVAGTDFYWPTTVPPGWAQITITDCPPGTEQIVFTSEEADPDIWVMETDGSSPVQLTNVTGLDQNPAWSHDATQIAFVSERSGDKEIWTMDSDGNNQTNRTNDAGEDFEPTWGMTPTGERIYFHSDRDGDFEIYWMTPTGGSQTNITSAPSAQDSSPDLSTDGQMIVFDTDRDTGVNPNVEIYTMTYTGGNVTRLTDDSAADFDPVWSPDGTMIAFVSDRDGNNEIYVMDAVDADNDGNGDNLIRLTDSLGVDEWPSWSEDGNHIIFGSVRSGNFEIYQMDPVDFSPVDGNGDNLVNLTNTTLANETRPDWSPVPVP